eukprot:TRINITY_DN6732_c0_g2_i1.p1 TRINITY_DN6732_c0_g2~~TRINITY_DN6732_c0_g2_i1.p1  ORF type:complete len:586 (+),score=76.36 TRINITY_DN6732_c0_g2_i1:75-1760(+)
MPPLIRARRVLNSTRAADPSNASFHHDRRHAIFSMQIGETTSPMTARSTAVATDISPVAPGPMAVVEDKSPEAASVNDTTPLTPGSEAVGSFVVVDDTSPVTLGAAATVNDKKPLVVGSAAVAEDVSPVADPNDEDPSPVTLGPEPVTRDTSPVALGSATDADGTSPVTVGAPASDDTSTAAIGSEAVVNDTSPVVLGSTAVVEDVRLAAFGSATVVEDTTSSAAASLAVVDDTIPETLGTAAVVNDTSLLALGSTTVVKNTSRSALGSATVVEDTNLVAFRSSADVENIEAWRRRRDREENALKIVQAFLKVVLARKKPRQSKGVEHDAGSFGSRSRFKAYHRGDGNTLGDDQRHEPIEWLADESIQANRQSGVTDGQGGQQELPRRNSNANFQSDKNGKYVSVSLGVRDKREDTRGHDQQYDDALKEIQSRFRGVFARHVLLPPARLQFATSVLRKKIEAIEVKRLSISNHHAHQAQLREVKGAGDVCRGPILGHNPSSGTLHAPTPNSRPESRRTRTRTRSGVESGDVDIFAESLRSVVNARGPLPRQVQPEVERSKA